MENWSFSFRRGEEGEDEEEQGVGCCEGGGDEGIGFGWGVRGWVGDLGGC